MSGMAHKDLIDFLIQHQLVSASNIEQFGAELNGCTQIEDLCHLLLKKGLITPYQQSQIITKQHDKLILGPYRLIEPIGEGGMGMVYKGWHPRLDRYSAIKLIRPQVLATRPEIVTRFHREAKAIAQLHHPNVVLLYDADEINGTHYIAMEYVDGQTLEKMVRINGPLSVKQSCDYMRQSALGLQHAYECGLVHRDIKPSNILVSVKNQAGSSKRSSSQLKRPALITIRDRDLAADPGTHGKSEQAWGVVKILDMGLARLQESLTTEEENPTTPLTRAGALLGTPDFISPEQARDARSVDIRADLYSLGCTFYFTLVGRPPFPGGSDVQKLIKHQKERPIPIEELRPHIPTAVTSIVERLMAKSPADRFQTPEELAEVLAEYLANSSSFQTPVRATVTDATIVNHGPISMASAHEPQEKSSVSFLDNFDSEVSGDKSPAHKAPIDISSSKEVLPVGIINAHKGVLSSVSLTADGRWGATGGVDGTIRIWDLKRTPAREMAMLARNPMEIQALTFVPNDPTNVVFGGTMHGNAHIQHWNWQENQTNDWGGYSTTDHRGIGCVSFSANGTMFTAGVGSFAVVSKVQKKAVSGKNTVKVGIPIRAIAISPDNKILATAGENRSIRLWGFGWLGTSLKATLESHADCITSLAFSPDGKSLACAGLAHEIVIWDLANPTAKTSSVLRGHAHNVRLIRFLPDGSHLLSVSEYGQVMLWNLDSKQMLAEFGIELSLAYSIALDGSGSRLAAGYSNGQFAIFDLPISQSLQQNVALTVTGRL